MANNPPGDNMTTETEELIALAERVEALTGPCHETDKAILAALGYTWRGSAYWAADNSHQWRGTTFFTKWLDAALTLVPEGWWWTTGNCSVSADASMGPDVAHCPKEMLLAFDEGLHHDLPHPSTPAISLTALALRARAAIIERERQQ